MRPNNPPYLHGAMKRNIPSSQYNEFIIDSGDRIRIIDGCVRIKIIKMSRIGCVPIRTIASFPKFNKAKRNALLGFFSFLGKNTTSLGLVSYIVSDASSIQEINYFFGARL